MLRAGKFRTYFNLYTTLAYVVAKKFLLSFQTMTYAKHILYV